jgi:hypothetical protein
MGPFLSSRLYLTVWGSGSEICKGSANAGPFAFLSPEPAPQKPESLNNKKRLFGSLVLQLNCISANFTRFRALAQQLT